MSTLVPPLLRSGWSTTRRCSRRATRRCPTPSPRTASTVPPGTPTCRPAARARVAVGTSCRRPGRPVAMVGDVADADRRSRAARVRRRARCSQVEAAVANRGEDPQPGLAELRTGSRSTTDRGVRRDPADLGPAGRARHARRGARRRLPVGAEVPHRRPGRRAVPDRRSSSPRSSAPAATASCRSSSPPGCTTPPAHRPGDRLHPPRLPQHPGGVALPRSTAPRSPRWPSARRHRPGAADRAGPGPPGQRAAAVGGLRLVQHAGAADRPDPARPGRRGVSR